MAGALAVPVMAILMVVDPAVALATKSSDGSMRSRLSSETMPRLNTRRRPPRVKSPRRSIEAARYRGRPGLAGDLKRAAHLGVETTAAHEHRLRRLHVERQPHRRGRRRLPRRAGRSRREAGRRARRGLLISRTSTVGNAAVWAPPTEISARSTVTGPVDVDAGDRRPRHLEVARHGRRQVGAVDQKRAAGSPPRGRARHPASGSRRIVPLAVSAPLRPVWKESCWSCSVSPCITRCAVPPLSRRPISGKLSDPLCRSSEPVPVIFSLLDIEGEIAAQGAGDAAHLVAEQRCQGREVDRAGNGDCAGKRCGRDLALERQTAVGAGTQARIDARLPADQRGRALHRKRRQQGRLGPAQPHARGSIGGVDAGVGHRTRNMHPRLQASVEAGARGERIDQATAAAMSDRAAGRSPRDRPRPAAPAFRRRRAGWRDRSPPGCRRSRRRVGAFNATGIP